MGHKHEPIQVVFSKSMVKKKEMVKAEVHFIAHDPSGVEFSIYKAVGEAPGEYAAVMMACDEIIFQVRKAAMKANNDA